MGRAVRTVDSRAEVLNPDGISLGAIRPARAQVSFEGDSSERWEGTLDMSGDYPASVDDMLHPLAGNRVRLWWIEDGSESVVMTGWPEDPGGRKAPTLTWSLKVLDTLTRAKRGGYGGQTIEAGGWTVTAALNALFEMVAPWAEVSMPDSTVTLPATYTLGATDDVEADWTKVAAVAGWTVYTDRMGAITAGPTPPGAEKADWQEGAGCVVVDLSVDLTTSDVKNAWLAKSTSAEVVPPIVGIAKDEDPGSPTYAGSYGPFWGTVELDSIATQEAADNAAAKALADSSRPTQTVTVSVPPRPDLEYCDVVSMGSADVGVVGPYKVESWRLTLPCAGQDPEHMTVTLASRSIL